MKISLTNQAEKDVSDIFDYTTIEFGFNQAEKYVLIIKSTLIKISKNPEIGRHRNDIKTNLLSLPCEQHIIFYSTIKNNLIIARVLHSSKDLRNFK